MKKRKLMTKRGIERERKSNKKRETIQYLEVDILVERRMEMY